MVEKTIGNKQGDSVTVNYTLADSCADTTVVGATSSVSWLSATVSTPSNHAGTITITATESGSTVIRHAFITPSINGEPCDNNRIKVTQQPGEPPEPGVLACYRGTDNGTDYFKDGTKQSHPILLCGDIGSTDGDSIYVEGGLEYSIDNKATWHQLTSGEGFKPASWVRVYLENNIGCCGNPYIGMETVEEFNGSGTNLERSITFWFKPHVYPSDGLVPACAAVICAGPAGKDLCKEWEYEIKQCAKGYYWCGDHTYTERPIPCDQECTEPKTDCKGRCGGSGGDGPTITIDGHDYTGDDNTIEYSACEGGSITFSVSESVSFTITPTDDGVKIDGNTSGNLSDGNHTITYEGVSDGQTKETTIKFENDDDETTTIKLKRKCDSQCTNPCENLNINLPVSSEGIRTITATSVAGNASFTYKCCQDLYVRKGSSTANWITVSKSYDSSTSVGTVSITYDANKTTSTRDCAILFSIEENGQPCNDQLKIPVFKQDGRESGSGAKVTIHNHTTGKTSPKIGFYNANGSQVGGIVRYNPGETNTSITWSNVSVPINKIDYTENNAPIKYISIYAQIVGQPPVNVLAKSEMGGTTGTINLTRTFDPADFDDGNNIISISFTDE